MSQQIIRQIDTHTMSNLFFQIINLFVSLFFVDIEGFIQVVMELYFWRLALGNMGKATGNTDDLLLLLLSTSIFVIIEAVNALVVLQPLNRLRTCQIHQYLRLDARFWKLRHRHIALWHTPWNALLVVALLYFLNWVGPSLHCYELFLFSDVSCEVPQVAF